VVAIERRLLLLLGETDAGEAGSEETGFDEAWSDAPEQAQGPP